ncbi:MAG: right-handed parallel beta-helix repeat-containing protein [bacterium]|nr:right-handed parallel beta-helix repeat-containing protein [bacterium]
MGKAMSAAVAVMLLVFIAAETAFGREISGRQSFTGGVIVPKGETWKVLPGAVVRFRGGRLLVRGTLVVEGTALQPATIEGDDAFEGVDLRGEYGSRFARAVVSGGRRGVLLTNASAEFREVTFKRNAVGIDVGQYARVRIAGCTFEGNSRAGLLVKRGGSAELSATRFSGAGKAGIYDYGAGNVEIRDCRFEKNTVGLQAGMAGARAQVSRSVFRGNGTGILAEKTARPFIEGCEVTGNEIGMSFRRRAEGTVKGCRVHENGTGVLVEYSSYPVFRGNTFRGNREAAVRLRHQSAEWEGEATEADREDAGARDAPFGGGDAARGDFRTVDDGRTSVSPAGPPGKRAGLTGTVDFRGNEWGELQPQVDRGGNVAGIHDGRDEPFFEYKGKRYRMDTVLLK